MSKLRRDIDSIIQGCKDEHRKAQAALYQEYAPVLFAVCLRYCAQRSDAEDCLHDGFMKIYDRIKSYQGKGSFEGWLKRVMVNVCLDKLRKQKDIFVYEEVEVEDETKEVDLGDYEATQLMQAMNKLPSQYRAVFNLYAIEQMSHKEIAQEFNIAVSTSRSNYLRAKLKLKEELETMGR